MTSNYWYWSLSVVLFSLLAVGAESYSELMDQAEKLTEKRYDPKSRAFKIKSRELDDILNSKESREEKIKRLQDYIKDIRGEKKSHDNSAAPLQSLKEAAEKGEPEPLYQLGMFYWEGRKVPRSLAKALHCFTRAAAKGHQPSRFMLALADLQGKGVIPNPKKAFAEFLQLYREGWTAAGIPLGILYYEGTGTEKNYKKALEYLKAGLEAKDRIPGELHPDAVIGKICYFGGYGVKPDPAQAFEHLKQCRNSAYEAYLLGTLYLSGKGCSRDPKSAAECFRIAAEHGYSQAGTELGRMYYTGTGVGKDDRMAVRYLNPAVEFDKSSEAAFLLAKIYSDKKSPVYNAKNALQNYRVAAWKSDPEAQYRIGAMILNGVGTEKNPKAALDYLQAAAKQNHKDAAYLCGEIEQQSGHPERSLAFYRQAADAGHLDGIRKFAGMALNGNGMKADPPLAIRYLEKLKDQADKTDLELLASLFESGIGPVKPNLDKAIRYYTLASEKGSIRSATRLALIYQALGKLEQAQIHAEKAAAKDPEAVRILLELKKNNPGNFDKENKTLRYLRELADSGDRNAIRQYGIHQFKLGKLDEAEKYLKTFADGTDPEILFMLGGIAYEKGDFKQAFSLFKRSSDSGNAKALIALGRMYHRGEGVRQDFRQALVCYRQAAEKQEPDGMFQTGLMYYNAEGTSPDYGEACRWFRMAAEQGNVLAMQYLSIMYKEGIGVPKNNIEALKWRRKAAGSHQ